MYLKGKTEKERLREQLDGAVLDLMMYRKHEGESPVLDANIRHKQKQIADLQARIAQIEQEEADAKEAEWLGMVADLERRSAECPDANAAEQTSFG